MTLADELVSRGWGVVFVSRRLPGNMIESVRGRGHTVVELPAPGVRGEVADTVGEPDLRFEVPAERDAAETKRALGRLDPAPGWLVVDHYGAGDVWHEALRGCTAAILAIDDLARDGRFCDLLLNQNYMPGVAERYRLLYGTLPRLLLGPGHALVRPEYRAARTSLAARDGRIRRIMVFYGSVDPSDETTKAIDAAVSVLGPDIALDVVIGSSNPHRERIGTRIGRLRNARLHVQLPHLAHLMSQCDLLLGAGGATLWECLLLGVPVLVTTTAENQAQNAAHLARDGIGIKLVGSYDRVTQDDLQRALEEADRRPMDLQRLRDSGMSLVDGLGAARVADAMGDGNQTRARPATRGRDRGAL